MRKEVEELSQCGDCAWIVKQRVEKLLIEAVKEVKIETLIETLQLAPVTDKMAKIMMEKDIKYGDYLPAIVTYESIERAIQEALDVRFKNSDFMITAYLGKDGLRLHGKRKPLKYI